MAKNDQSGRGPLGEVSLRLVPVSDCERRLAIVGSLVLRVVTGEEDQRTLRSGGTTR